MSMPIKSMVLRFLREVIESECVDVLVPVERKGTALLRSLLETVGEERLDWQWENVVSTAALGGHAAEERIAGRTILLFDDLTRGGHHFADAEEQLQKLGPAEIIKASLGVHKDYEDRPGESRSEMPDRYVYRRLGDEAYQRLRRDIIALLQEEGSLLLDTEHLELRVRANCSVSQFFSSAANIVSGVHLADRHARSSASVPRGGVSFVSPGGRPNLTVCAPIRAEEGSVDVLLRKVRFVWLPDGRCTVIPICFPDVTEERTEEFSHHIEDSGVFSSQGEGQTGTGGFLSDSDRKRALFYRVGLVKSLELLGDVVGALRAMGPRVTIDLATDCGSDGATGEAPELGFRIRHLLSVYPGLHLHRLAETATSLGSHARPKGDQRTDAGRHVSLDARKMGATAEALLRLLVRRSELGEAPLHVWSEGQRSRTHRLALRYTEILALREALTIGNPNALSVSAALDYLIDAGDVLPRVLHTHAGWSRAFAPAGEGVEQKARRCNELLGLPR